MRRFSFRLATLLKVRERAVDSAATELRRVEAEIDATREYECRLREEQIRVEEETLRKIGDPTEKGAQGARSDGRVREDGGTSRGCVSAAELRDRRLYTDFLCAQLDGARRRLSLLGELREQKRRDWWRRRRDWKAVQKVREREWNRWQLSGTKEEQKMIDEMAQNGAGERTLSRRDDGSAMKAVLVAVLVAGLTVALLYSVRSIGAKKVAFLETVINQDGQTVLRPAAVAGAGVSVTSATEAAAATPTPPLTGMLVTSDMIQETLAQVAAERERLQEREAALDAWERRLDHRQSELEALVARYDRLRQEIDADLAEQRALKEWRESEERREREANIKRLARLYEKTRPREAASMMLELEKTEAQEVLLAMNERQAVRILGEMSKASPERASQLLESISEEPGRLAPPTPIP